MLKRIILILTCNFWLVSFGQKTGEIYFSTIENSLFPEEAAYDYLLAHDVNLRRKPSSASKALKRLSIGTRFIILERGDSTMMRKGITSHWYKVKLDDGTGWIWGGFIARHAFRSVNDPSIAFVYGYDKITRNDAGDIIGIYHQIRAFKNNEPIDKIRIKPFASDIVMIQNMGNKGLKNVDDIFTMQVDCRGGCGCLTGEIIVFWSDHKLSHVANLEGTPDGEFSQGDSFVFPSDMEGIPGQIIRVKSRVGRENYEQKKLRRYLIKEYYFWNGESLQKSDRKIDRKKFWIPLK